MTAEDVTTTILDDASLARVDKLARLYGVTRDEMIARIVVIGVLTQERQAQEGRTRADVGGS